MIQINTYCLYLILVYHMYVCMSYSFLRILEVVKIKCGDREAEIWPYMLQQLQPTLAELGIPGLAELGYDQPELALPNPYEIH